MTLRCVDEKPLGPFQAQVTLKTVVVGDNAIEGLLHVRVCVGASVTDGGTISWVTATADELVQPLAWLVTVTV